MYLYFVNGRMTMLFYSARKISLSLGPRLREKRARGAEEGQKEECPPGRRGSEEPPGRRGRLT